VCLYECDLSVEIKKAQERELVRRKLAVNSEVEKEKTVFGWRRWRGFDFWLNIGK